MNSFVHGQRVRVNHPEADGKPFYLHGKCGVVTAVPGDDDGSTAGRRGSYAVRIDGAEHSIAPFGDHGDVFPLIEAEDADHDQARSA